MTKAVKVARSVLAIAFLGAVSSSFAEQMSTLDIPVAQQEAVKGSLYRVGLGVAVVPEYEGSEDYKAAPVPYFQGSWQNGMYVQLFGSAVWANVVPSKTWEAGPMLRYHAKRDDVSNDRVDEMEEVDSALDAGGFVGFRYRGWTLRLDGGADVAGSYSGYLLTLRGGYNMTVNDRTGLIFMLSTTYADENYMQTYFGVSERDEERSGLEEYDADGGIKDVSATVVATYRFNSNWGLIGALRYTQLVGDAADSPIVDDEGSAGQLVAGVAVTYTF